jgi:uroporphyrinogen decarboxylase
MTSRDVVHKAIRFQTPPRLPYSLTKDYGSDIARVNMQPSVDARPGSGPDEWGAIWYNVGVSRLGEVIEWPIKDWTDFASLKIPDVTEPRRWQHLSQVREKAPDKFLIGTGIAIYERAHFLRGLENLWVDTIENPEQLGRLLDVLVEMNLYAIDKYAAAGMDGFMFCDDWGLQNRLMISPHTWRHIWKPRYQRIYQAAREAGLCTLLHSCGYIVDILDDLIEIGLDVIQMDQQENMGLRNLADRFAGRITFWCPVDIQKTMRYGTPDDIRNYCRKLAAMLGTPQGGFIAQWYADPEGAGHSPEAVTVMCEEFVRISEEIAHQGEQWWERNAHLR